MPLVEKQESATSDSMTYVILPRLIWSSAELNLVAVKEILGHATIQMTMRYAHPTPENKRRAVDVLAGLFTAVGEKPGRLNRETVQIAS